MTLEYRTDHWDFYFSEPCTLEIENLNVKEGYTLKDIDDVVAYLTYVCFANDYVSIYSIREALYDVSKELGCVYEDVYELENDIRRYYI